MVTMASFRHLAFRIRGDISSCDKWIEKSVHQNIPQSPSHLESVVLGVKSEDLVALLEHVDLHVADGLLQLRQLRVT